MGDKGVSIIIINNAGKHSDASAVNLVLVYNIPSILVKYDKYFDSGNSTDNLTGVQLVDLGL